MKRVIQIFLLVVIIVLGYLLYRSIMQPIEFKKERIAREEATIERLKDIRKAQVAFKTKYNRYTPSFDTLINFVKTDSFEIKKNLGNYDPDVMTLAQAKRAGFIITETTKVAVKDSLFHKKFNIENIRYVPYTDKSEKFHMDARIIESGGLKVPVFEASVKNDILLNGLDKRLIANYNEERLAKVKFEGLKVGSIDESNNNAGNWE